MVDYFAVFKKKSCLPPYHMLHPYFFPVQNKVIGIYIPDCYKTDKIQEKNLP